MSWNRHEPAGGDSWSTDEWLAWLVQSCEILPVAGWGEHRCAGCWAPSQLDADGEPYHQCFKCLSITGLIRRTRSVTPIAYGTFDGLTGLIRAYKDGMRWLSLPLAALLQSFVDLHLAHIVDAVGGCTHVSWVPCHPSRPAGDHLRPVVENLSLPPGLQLAPAILRKVTTDSAGRSLHPRAFEADGVSGATVLIIDDVLTTGGTLASAAFALRQADAKSVSALVLARHLNPATYPSHGSLIAHQRALGFDPTVCARESAR